jgi:hypothetical protein
MSARRAQDSPQHAADADIAVRSRSGATATVINTQPNWSTPDFVPVTGQLPSIVRYWNHSGGVFSKNRRVELVAELFRAFDISR